MSEADAHRALLDAAAVGDERQLLALYRGAGERHLAAGAQGPGCFYLTHAYVYALVLGDEGAEADIGALLRARGRL